MGIRMIMRAGREKAARSRRRRLPRSDPHQKPNVFTIRNISGLIRAAIVGSLVMGYYFIKSSWVSFNHLSFKPFLSIHSNTRNQTISPLWSCQSYIYPLQPSS